NAFRRSYQTRYSLLCIRRVLSSNVVATKLCSWQPLKALNPFFSAPWGGARCTPSTATADESAARCRSCKLRAAGRSAASSLAASGRPSCG
ncbi:hypothetical protein PHMEG_00040619, partial [Phytophthora megakarya]